MDNPGADCLIFISVCYALVSILCSECPVPNRDAHIAGSADQVELIIGEKTTFSRFLPPLKGNRQAAQQ